ncbi:hypothetical protein GCM10027565_28300 [Bordetella tumulicola]
MPQAVPDYPPHALEAPYRLKSHWSDQNFAPYDHVKCPFAEYLVHLMNIRNLHPKFIVAITHEAAYISKSKT